VPDYYEIVQEPIDLRMIADRIESGDYYITLEARGAALMRCACDACCMCAAVADARVLLCCSVLCADLCG
jgi:hypothetical protein